MCASETLSRRLGREQGTGDGVQVREPVGPLPASAPAFPISPHGGPFARAGGSGFSHRRFEPRRQPPAATVAPTHGSPTCPKLTWHLANVPVPWPTLWRISKGPPFSPSQGIPGHADQGSGTAPAPPPVAVLRQAPAGRQRGHLGTGPGPGQAVPLLCACPPRPNARARTHTHTHVKTQGMRLSFG